MSLRKRTRRLVSAAVILAVCAIGATVSMWDLGADDAAHLPALDEPGSVVINAEVLNYASPMETPDLADDVEALLTTGDGSLHSTVISNDAQKPEPTPEPAPVPTAAPSVAPTAALTTSPTAEPTATPVPTQPAAEETPEQPDFVEEAYTEGLRIGTVTGKSVYYRSKPTTDGKKLGSLTKGSAVVVFALADGWYKVNVAGTVGYMSADYVTSADEGDGKLGYGKVTGSVVHLRDRAAIAGKSLAKLPEGTGVTLLGVSNGWYKVKYGNTTGYMHGEYVEPTEKITAAPSKAPAASAGTTSSTFSATETVTFGSSPYKALDNAYAEEIQKILDLAHAQLGVPYVWGGTTRKGFDCGGLIYYIFRNLGYTDFPRTKQWTAGTKVTYSQLVPGDLVYFSNNGAGAGHVGLYVGDGMFIHAPSPGKKVQYTTLASGYYRNHFLYGARIIGDV
ncbi:MAG: C40 family peptidase [Clostridia bacterium]|nr:C40 family peptidase [Clostridia bacterium]